MPNRNPIIIPTNTHSEQSKTNLKIQTQTFHGSHDDKEIRTKYYWMTIIIKTTWLISFALVYRHNNSDTKFDQFKQMSDPSCIRNNCL